MSYGDIRIAAFLFLVVALAVCNAAQAVPTFSGPTPYLSFADSPFNGGSFGYFHLEDFEDGALNEPGVTVGPLVVIDAPGPFTDSVDGDDGTIDGSGTAGRSLFSNAATSSFSFTFDAGVLGSLPTHAGIVWTDVGQVSSGNLGFGLVTFEAFGPASESLGSLGPFTLGDGAATGGTAEDRFFGVTNPLGVSRIVISTTNSTDWEVDHLQYGGSVPEPGALALCAAAAAAAIAWRRRS
jgi:PEP-CTERM motif